MKAIIFVILTLTLILSENTLALSFNNGDFGDPPNSYHCVHQEIEPSGKFLKAYRYATVLFGEQCPPFNESFETPFYGVSSLGVNWTSSSAIPNTTQEYICVGSSCLTTRLEEMDPLDHTCRFGLMNGDDY